MNISFKGFDEKAVTFEADSTLKKAGVAVTVKANGKVAPCAEDDRICGVALSVRDGYAAVLLRGYAELPYSGNIAPGFQNLAVNENGKIEINEDGREILVVSVNSDGTAGIIL